MLALRGLILAGGCFAATGLFAQGSQQYLIESELWMNGQVQDVPVMVIGENEPGFLFKTDENGQAEEGGWRLEITANSNDDPLNLSDALWLDVGLSLFEAGRWRAVLDSMLGVPEGEFASLSVAAEDEQASPEQAEVFLRLRTSRLQQTND